MFVVFKVILIVVSVCTATGAWNWLIDPDTQKVNICYQLKLVSLIYKNPYGRMDFIKL